jgi:hypothetical protein
MSHLLGVEMRRLITCWAKGGAKTTVDFGEVGAIAMPKLDGLRSDHLLNSLKKGGDYVHVANDQPGWPTEIQRQDTVFHRRI